MMVRVYRVTSNKKKINKLGKKRKTLRVLGGLLLYIPVFGRAFEIEVFHARLMKEAT